MSTEDLKNLAGPLLERVRAIDGEEKVARLDAMIAAVRMRQQELQRDWDAFEAAIVPLMTLVEEEAFRIREAVVETIDAVADLAEPLTDAASAIVEDLHRAGPAVQTLANAADALDPDLATRLETVVLEPARGVVAEAKAVGDSLAAGLEAVVALVGEAFLARTADCQEQVTLDGDVLRMVGPKVSAALKVDFEDWCGRMEDIVDKVEQEGVKPAGVHAQAAATAALADCREAQTDALAQVAANVRASHQMMSDVAGQLETLDRGFREEAEPFENEAAACVRTLDRALVKLDEVSETLTARGFGS